MMRSRKDAAAESAFATATTAFRNLCAEQRKIEANERDTWAHTYIPRCFNKDLLVSEKSRSDVSDNPESR